MIKYLLFVGILVGMACQPTSEKPKYNEFIIKGKLDGVKNKKIVLYRLSKEQLPLDSLKINEHGEFFFIGTIDEPSFFKVVIDSKKSILLLVDREEVVDISGFYPGLDTSLTIQGSIGSQALCQLEKQTYLFEIQMDSLSKVWHEHKYSPTNMGVKEQLDSLSDKYLGEQQDFLRRFIDANTHSLVSMVALFSHFGRQPLLTPQHDFSYFDKVDKSLSTQFPKNENVLYLTKLVDEIRVDEARRKIIDATFAIGNTTTDIALPNDLGEVVKLSSLKGKHVVVCFWGSWHKQAQAQLSQLLPYYKKHKNKGLEIYAIGIEKDKSSWSTAIKQKNMGWVNVSDVLFWESPVVKLYNISELPYFILLDTNGKIVAKHRQVDKIIEVLNQVYISTNE